MALIALAKASSLGADLDRAVSAEAEALGVMHRTIPIEPAFKAFMEMLAKEFAGQPVDSVFHIVRLADALLAGSPGAGRPGWPSDRSL